MKNSTVKCPVCGAPTNKMYQIKIEKNEEGVKQTLQARCFSCESLFRFNRMIYFGDFYNIEYIPDKEE